MQVGNEENLLEDCCPPLVIGVHVETDASYACSQNGAGVPKYHLDKNREREKVCEPQAVVKYCVRHS
jgi:hypothetical protein